MSQSVWPLLGVLDNTTGLISGVTHSPNQPTTSLGGTVTASSIGLGNVNNTADVDKPVSTVQAAAIAACAPLLPSVVRALGNGMRAAILGSPISGGGSLVYRSRHHTNRSFVRVAAVIPIFQTTNFVDTLLSNPFFFQCGFEYPYVGATSGLAPRQAFTWGGSNTASYNPASPPSTGYLQSDWLTLPTSNQPKGDSFFGLHTAVEHQALTNNTLPAMDYGSNVAQAFECYQFATTSLVTANTALTATSYPTASASSGAGSLYSFTPCFLLIDYGAGDVQVLIFGDSIADGYGEGRAGSGNYGALSTGSAYRNSGFIARGLDENLGLNYAKVAVPGDSFSTFNTGNNAIYRKQLIQLANPTHIIANMGTNDLAAGTGASSVLSLGKTAYTTIKGLLPNAKIVPTTVLPRSTTTDSGATVANQTALGGFGAATSNRGLFNAQIRQGGSSAMNADGYIETCVQSQETSLWNVTGAANGWSADMIHPNGYGHTQLASAIKHRHIA